MAIYSLGFSGPDFVGTPDEVSKMVRAFNITEGNPDGYVPPNNQELKDMMAARGYEEDGVITPKPQVRKFDL